jgi:hypothetical protein
LLVAVLPLFHKDEAFKRIIKENGCSKNDYDIITEDDVSPFLNVSHFDSSPLYANFGGKGIVLYDQCVMFLVDRSCVQAIGQSTHAHYRQTLI